MKLLFFESEIKMPVMKLPVRTTVVKTANALIVISPVDLTSEQLKRIRQLGEVTDLVAPSVLHHLYMKKAIAAFPTATVWGMPGLKDKCPDIRWGRFLTIDAWPYQDEIEALPVNGVPGMAEVAFYCKEPRVLIVTDLCFNLQNPKGLGAAVILRMLGTYGQFAVSRLVGRFMKDEKAFQESIQKILQKDIEQIVMAHGEILTHDGRRLLEKALQERNYLN
jgi:hypothetical protein